MIAPARDLPAALASLQARWGAAAPRVVGSLATVPLPDRDPTELPLPEPAAKGVVSTGFTALDAILGPGGLPRSAGVSLRGAASSGATTLALRLVAEAQAAGLIAAWLDLAHSFDPVEAVARGVEPAWLVVVTPASLDEALSIAGSLLSGRSVDLLVVDLPGRVPGVPAASTPPGSSRPSGSRPGGAARAGEARRPGVAGRLARLAALARRAGSLFVVIEPPGLAAGLAGAVTEATSLRLELERRAWIRLGRDIVGQRIAVMVARSRFGPPGRQAELRILYADGGERDACLRHEVLLREGKPAAPPGDVTFRDRPFPRSLPATHHTAAAPGIRHASAPSLLAASSPGPRPTPFRLLPAGTSGGRRQAVGAGDRSGRELRGAGARRPARDPARRGAPAGA